ncbi:hypothetical protein [Streptosporangium sp. NPDC049078]|uniref:hypothetical protein n=1 Tax=Streptosporangium sp. NPDC049078 TaxID=3155767 RepID=UPI0034273ABA
MNHPPQGPQQPHGQPPVYVNVNQTVQQHTHIGGGGRIRVRWTFWEIMLVLFTCGLAWPYVWARHRRIRRAHRRW